MAVTHNAISSIRSPHVLPQGDENIGLGDQRLGQDAAGTLPGKFIQGIVDGVWLTERKDVAIS
jgi:hypothetical protein